MNVIDLLPNHPRAPEAALGKDTKQKSGGAFLTLRLWELLNFLLA